MGIKGGLKLPRNHKTSPCVDSTVNPNCSSFCTSWGPGGWKPVMFENRSIFIFVFLFYSHLPIFTITMRRSSWLFPNSVRVTTWRGRTLKKTLQLGLISSLKSHDLTEVIGSGLKIISTTVHRWVVRSQLVDPRNYCVVPLRYLNKIISLKLFRKGTLCSFLYLVYVIEMALKLRLHILSLR